MTCFCYNTRHNTYCPNGVNLNGTTPKDEDLKEIKFRVLELLDLIEKKIKNNEPQAGE